MPLSESVILARLAHLAKPVEVARAVSSDKRIAHGYYFQWASLTIGRNPTATQEPQLSLIVIQTSGAGLTIKWGAPVLTGAVAHPSRNLEPLYCFGLLDSPALSR